MTCFVMQAQFLIKDICLQGTVKLTKKQLSGATTCHTLGERMTRNMMYILSWKFDGTGLSTCGC